MQSNPNKADKSASTEIEVHNLFRSAFFSLEYRLSPQKAPWGITQFSKVDLGGISLIFDQGYGTREIIRSPQHITDNPISFFSLLLPINAKATLIQDGKQTVCTPGTFRLASSSSPFYASVSGNRLEDVFTFFHLLIPGSLLRRELPSIDNYCNHIFEIHPGPAQVMQSLIRLAFENRNDLCAEEKGCLGDTLLRLIRATIVKESPVGDTTSIKGRSNRDRILEKAKQFIFCNLSNPDLDGRSVAEHCGISERYLRTIFTSADLQVGSYIRTSRLLKCRESLTNPILRHRSVRDIAINWGYIDSSSFSRAYKSEFGKSPREDRAIGNGMGC